MTETLMDDYVFKAPLPSFDSCVKIPDIAVESVVDTDAIWGVGGASSEAIEAPDTIAPDAVWGTNGISFEGPLLGEVRHLAENGQILLKRLPFSGARAIARPVDKA